MKKTGGDVRMKNGRCIVLSLGMLATALTPGCASRYFADPGCHVDCTYRAAPPLPFAYYQDCACHSCAASPYLVAYPASDDTPLSDGADAATTD
jgi:hypothetical protein